MQIKELIWLSIELNSLKKRTDLADDRTKLANKRTDLANKRTSLAEHRTQLSEKRTDLANKRTDWAQMRTQLSEIRTRLAGGRTELARNRTNFAQYRTIMARIRTELSYLRTGVGFIALGCGFMRYFGWGWWTILDFAIILMGACVIGIAAFMFKDTLFHERKVMKQLEAELTYKALKKREEEIKRLLRFGSFVPDREFSDEE